MFQVSLFFSFFLFLTFIDTLILIINLNRKENTSENGGITTVNTPNPNTGDWTTR